MDNVIETRGLRKSFPAKGGPVDAVKGVSIDVRRGEIFGFLGPNGAGKTTTLRMLTTLLPIGSGTATVAGFDVARQPKQVRERIGYVSQLGGADELATGRENLILQGRLYGAARAQVAPRAAELARLLDLAEFADRRVSTYSGGQRRRLDIALGLIHSPPLMFLDEPTSGLDPQARANLWDHIRSLRAAGTTIFLTTHYLEEADALCDRVLVIDHGEIVTQGTPEQLKRGVGRDHVTLALADPRQADAAGVALRELGQVEGLRTEENEVAFDVAAASATLPAAFDALAAGGIRLAGVEVRRPSLDDVFLSVTGRALRDEPTAA